LHKVIRDLSEAITEFVHDGDTVAMEGFTHLIPFGAAHEIIRQKIRNLTLVRMTPDLIYDRLIGAGCASKIIFGWGGNPGVGSLHRFRDAIQNSWPNPLEIEEHSHAGLANRYVAGASGLPFTVLRGYLGSDLLKYTENVKIITCPFTGERLAAVAALNPDVTIIHAQQADQNGNVMLWGITGIQKEAVLAARKVLVTVEEVVDGFEPQKNAIILPSFLISAVCLNPKGAAPSYALGYYGRDNDAYVAWNAISKERDSFLAWLDSEVFQTEVIGAR
jgi:glutaconate CoA-transferase subunit A